MSAADVLDLAAHAGLQIKVCSRGLALEAAKEPPAELIDEIWAHKIDIAALLAAEDSQRRLRRGYESLLAYSFAVDMVFRSLPREARSDICATCGRPPGKVLIWLNGAVTCLDEISCMVEYGTRLRRTCVEFLRGAGIEPPKGWTLPDGSAPGT